MSPRTIAIIAAALILVLGRAAFDTGSATVVRDAKGATANPAVEKGGYHPQPMAPPPVPYSLIGAIADDNRWFPSCLAWPLSRFRPLSLHGHRNLNRINMLPPGTRTTNWLPPLAP